MNDSFTLEEFVVIAQLFLEAEKQLLGSLYKENPQHTTKLYVMMSRLYTLEMWIVERRRKYLALATIESSRQERALLHSLEVSADEELTPNEIFAQKIFRRLYLRKQLAQKRAEINRLFDRLEKRVIELSEKTWIKI